MCASCVADRSSVLLYCFWKSLSAKFKHLQGRHKWNSMRFLPLLFFTCIYPLICTTPPMDGIGIRLCRNGIAFIVSRSSQFCTAIAIFNTTALGFWSQTGGFDCNAIEGQSSSPSPHWIVVNLCAIHKSSSLWLFLARSDFFGFNLSRDLRARAGTSSLFATI